MIIFFGPAGAGKSMQGQMMAARHNWRWLSAGQLLRDTHDHDLAGVMAKGELAPMEKVNAIVGDALKRAGDVDHVILDGFPRQIEQAHWLLETQEEHDHPIQLVIVLNVPRDEIYGRLKVRGRLDDQPEVIDARLEQYADETGKILDLFTKHEVPIELVDGTGTVGEVHDRIDAILTAHGIANVDRGEGEES